MMYRPSSFSHRPTMSVCFVCGNSAYEEKMVLLYSRNPRSQHVDAAFFPFLEYHDPAPGAEPMRDDWSVVSCFVCNAFLLQQWESFERTRTPISKRLYWLKRPSGCDIRQPVSQIELEEILNEHSRDNFEEGEESYDSDEDRLQSQQSSKMQSEPSERPNQGQALSTETNQESSSNADDASGSKIVCYFCGKIENQNCPICPIHCKPSYEQIRTGVPFYPTILKETPAAGAKVMSESITFVCISCLPRFNPEWHVIQQDFINQDSTKSVLPRIPLPENVLCYTCSSEVNTKYNDGLLQAVEHSVENPLVSALKLSKYKTGAVPLSFGFTYVCPKCKENLQKGEQHG